MTTRLTDIQHDKPEPYVAIPVTLLKDKSISAEAVRLYGFIVQQVFFRKSNKLYMTNAEWSKLVGKSHDYVTKYLKELEAGKYIAISRSKSFWNSTWVNTRVITLKGKRASIGM